MDYFRAFVRSIASICRIVADANKDTFVRVPQQHSSRAKPDFIRRFSGAKLRINFHMGKVCAYMW